MPFPTRLCKALGITYPIIQAPMAGGITTPSLIASIANAGGLGSLGAGYLSAEQMKTLIQQTRELTRAPFAVNLFVPQAHQANASQIDTASQAIAKCAARLGEVIEPVISPFAPSFEHQIQTLIEQQVSIASFTFGLPKPAIIDRLKTNGVYIIATATTLKEAQLLEASNIDAIVLQGSEAGGHRGNFLDSTKKSLVALDQLVLQTRQSLTCPLIAAGGIMDGQSIVHHINLGASAVQLGTAFLCSDESGASPTYKTKILAQSHDTTVLTKAFSGKYARGIANHFTRCMQSQTDAILDYPIQNRLTRKMREHAKQSKDSDFMSLWAGQFLHKARQGPADALFMQLLRQAQWG